MTVQEFVNAVTKNPNLLNLELCIVTKCVTVEKGQFDGGIQLQSKSVQSATIGVNGLLLFVNPKDDERGEVFLVDASKFPAVTVIGPTPDYLKWSI